MDDIWVNREGRGCRDGVSDRPGARHAALLASGGDRKMSVNPRAD